MVGTLMQFQLENRDNGRLYAIKIIKKDEDYFNTEKRFYISEKENIDRETVNVVIEFMKRHQYDTDAFRNDWNTINNTQSNLYNICNGSMEFASTSNQFITNIDCMLFII